MNSTGEHLHPNWRALATLHISLKRFVPAGVNPTNDETLSLARHELSSDFNGEKVKEFYENIIQDEQNTSNCSPPQMASKLEKPRVKIVKIPFEAAKLFRAAMSNDVQTIENMQFDNDDINAKDAYGWTALMMAACDNSKAAVELLLHLGANRQIKDKSGNTAEALANLKGHTDVVGLLRNYTTEIHEEKIDQEKAVLNERHVESFDCETCKETFTNTSEKAHYTSTLHRFCHKSALPTNTLHKFNIAPRNRGLKLMKKQGWDCASGLGPSQSGRLYPIKTVIRKDRTGLGVNQNAARVAHFHAFDLRATKSHKNHNKPRTRNDIKPSMEGQKAMSVIRSTEEVADKILMNKAELVQLDKRRQQTREAIRAMEKLPAEEKKVWITIGSMLIKMERSKAVQLLKNDAATIELEISKLESEQRVLVNKHRDLEHFSPYSGTGLKPFSHKEFAAFKANFPLL